MLEFLRIFHIRVLSRIFKSYQEKKRIGFKGIMMSVALIFGHGVAFAASKWFLFFFFFFDISFIAGGGGEMAKACFQNLLQ